ncbi:MAG: hypothetical protein SGBAC_010293 [Bacillariaceae sp.]
MATEDAHKYEVNLQPLPEDKRLVVFGEEYTSDKPVALHLKTKWSLSGNSMSVKDQFGEKWFSIKGVFWSLSETKVIFGKDDKPLFLIADKSWWNIFDDAQVVFDCRGAEDLKEAKDVKKDKTKIVCSVKSNLGNTKQDTTVKSSGAKGDMDEMVDIVGKCTFFNQKCAMWRDGDYKSGGIPIANFMSPLEVQNFFDFKSFSGDPTEDYYLTVAPGADIAFCLAFVIAIREMNHSYK